jgi:hypothetical protein
VIDKISSTLDVHNHVALPPIPGTLKLEINNFDVSIVENKLARNIKSETVSLGFSRTPHVNYMYMYTRFGYMYL